MDALDLRTLKPDGSPWNFSDPADRKYALQLVRDRKPRWVIGSPPCTMFSSLMAINKGRMGPLKYEALLLEAKRHLHFAIAIYTEQLKAGRHFLHEHPHRANSRKDSWMEKSLQLPGVHSTI